MTGIECAEEHTPEGETEPIVCHLHFNHVGAHVAYGWTWGDIVDKPKVKQVGGNHYQGGDLQPIDVIDAFHLDFYEGNALKYLLRHGKKNGKEDLEKAIHYIEMIIERRYP